MNVALNEESVFLEKLQKLVNDQLQASQDAAASMSAVVGALATQLGLSAGFFGRDKGLDIAEKCIDEKTTPALLCVGKNLEKEVTE